jgi:hypothetical protein
MSRAYLVLDRIQIANLTDRLFELTGGATVHSLYQRTAYSALENVGPVLIGVTPDSPLAQIFSQEWSATAGIWLESATEPGQVLAHLRGLIHARVEGVTTVLFRFFDPRIAALWLTALPAHERDRQMGPVRLIRLPDSQILQQSQHPVIPYADQPWLSLTAEQLDHLNATRRQFFTEQLIEHVQRNFPEAILQLDPAARQQWALDCQAGAARNGFSAMDEVLLWSRFVAVLGNNFPDDPEHGVYRQLLAEPGIAPSRRLDNLNHVLTHQLLTDKDFAQ